MFNYLTSFLLYFRPCFSRGATYNWFVVIFVGLMLREDTFGVTSIIRALALLPSHYECILHFFHSTAIDLDKLLRFYWLWVSKSNLGYQYNGCPVFLGDHTKNTKDGRKIPAVATLHQESETASKPSYFRGHNWGCISMLTCLNEMMFSTPLWGQIHQPLNLMGVEEEYEPMTTRIVSMVSCVAKTIQKKGILVLDAFFAVGPVFDKAKNNNNDVHITILTRAKSNIVAYCDPVIRKYKSRGRPRKYGKKLKLMKYFSYWKKKFLTAQAIVYGNNEEILYYSIALIWRPVKRKILFIWVQTSRGKIILMCSDLNMNPVKAIEMYCYRAKIETAFSVLKNIFGITKYHFWSSHLLPQSRTPAKNDKKRKSTNPEKTKKTLRAIEIYFNIQAMVVGVMQLICLKHTHEVATKADTWLRTFNPKTPSEFMAKKAMKNLFFKRFCCFDKNEIIDLIRQKQKNTSKRPFWKRAA